MFDNIQSKEYPLASRKYTQGDKVNFQKKRGETRPLRISDLSAKGYSNRDFLNLIPVSDNDATATPFELIDTIYSTFRAVEKIEDKNLKKEMQHSEYTKTNKKIDKQRGPYFMDLTELEKVDMNKVSALMRKMFLNELFDGTWVSAELDGSLLDEGVAKNLQENDSRWKFDFNKVQKKAETWLLEQNLLNSKLIKSTEDRLDMSGFFNTFCECNQTAFSVYKKLGMKKTADLEFTRYTEKRKMQEVHKAKVDEFNVESLLQVIQPTSDDDYNDKSKEKLSQVLRSQNLFDFVETVNILKNNWPNMIFQKWVDDLNREGPMKGEEMKKVGMMDISECGIKPANIIRNLILENRASKYHKITTREIFARLCSRLLPLRDIAAEIQLQINNTKPIRKKNSSKQVANFQKLPSSIKNQLYERVSNALKVKFLSQLAVKIDPSLKQNSFRQPQFNQSPLAQIEATQFPSQESTGNSRYEKMGNRANPIFGETKRDITVNQSSTRESADVGFPKLFKKNSSISLQKSQRYAPPSKISSVAQSLQVCNNDLRSKDSSKLRLLSSTQNCSLPSTAPSTQSQTFKKLNTLSKAGVLDLTQFLNKNVQTRFSHPKRTFLTGNSSIHSSMETAGSMQKTREINFDYAAAPLTQKKLGKKERNLPRNLLSSQIISASHDFTLTRTARNTQKVGDIANWESISRHSSSPVNVQNATFYKTASLENQSTSRANIYEERNRLSPTKTSHDQAETQRIIDMCSQFAKDKRPVKIAVRDAEIELAVEEYHQDQYMTLYTMLKELNESMPSNLKKLFNYKLTQDLEQEHLQRQVVFQYQQGISDPQRPTAQFEKQDHIKMVALNVNKKAVSTPSQKKKPKENAAIPGKDQANKKSQLGLK